MHVIGQYHEVFYAKYGNLEDSLIRAKIILEGGVLRKLNNFNCMRSNIARYAGSNPAEVDGLFQDVKILSTSPLGGTLSWGSRV